MNNQNIILNHNVWRDVIFTYLINDPKCMRNISRTCNDFYWYIQELTDVFNIDRIEYYDHDLKIKRYVPFTSKYFGILTPYSLFVDHIDASYFGYSSIYTHIHMYNKYLHLPEELASSNIVHKVKIYDKIIQVHEVNRKHRIRQMDDTSYFRYQNWWIQNNLQARMEISIFFLKIYNIICSCINLDTITVKINNIIYTVFPAPPRCDICHRRVQKHQFHCKICHTTCKEKNHRCKETTSSTITSYYNSNDFINNIDTDLFE